MSCLYLIAYRDVIVNMEVIKICKAANAFGSIVKQTETVTHEVRNRIGHLKRCAYGFP